MRRLPLLIIGLLLLLTACGNAEKRGEAAGHAFLAAWGDTAAMRQSVQRFNALPAHAVASQGRQSGICKSAL